MPLLVCLPTPVYILYLLAYWPRPVQANKKSAPVFVRAGTEDHLHALPTLHGLYEGKHVDEGWHRLFRKFALFESYAIILFHSFLS